jgi:hypothetical protein
LGAVPDHDDSSGRSQRKITKEDHKGPRSKNTKDHKGYKGNKG